MNVAMLTQMVFQRLIRFPGKTVAMALGIVASVFATVLLQSSAIGFTKALRIFNARSYPEDAVVIFSTTGSMSAGAARNLLKLTDIEVLRSSLPEIADWDPIVVGGPRDIKRGDRNASVLVVGVSERAPEVRRRGTVLGQFFESDDVRRRSRAALIGLTTARRLFKGESPLGGRLFIDNIAFDIQGVLEPFGVDPHGIDQDDIVEIPYTTMMEQVMRIDYLSACTLRLTGADLVKDTGVHIESILRQQHRINAGQEDDFEVVTPLKLQVRVKKALKVFDVFIPLICGCAFFISGLIIFVIMLISVNERTSEIGLRKALGATHRDIQIQFLIEVTGMSTVAAVIGLLSAEMALVGAAGMFKEKFGVTNALPSGRIALLAAGLSIVTALLATAIPIWRAASLDAARAVRMSK